MTIVILPSSFDPQKYQNPGQYSLCHSTCKHLLLKKAQGAIPSLSTGSYSSFSWIIPMVSCSLESLWEQNQDVFTFSSGTFLVLFQGVAVSSSRVIHNLWSFGSAWNTFYQCHILHKVLRRLSTFKTIRRKESLPTMEWRTHHSKCGGLNSTTPKYWTIQWVLANLCSHVTAPHWRYKDCHNPN